MDFTVPKVNSIYDHVNGFLIFRDSKKQEAFYKFHMMQMSFPVALLAILAICIYFILSRTGFLMYHYSNFAIFNCAFTMSTSVFLGLWGLVMRYFKLYRSAKWLVPLRDFWIVSIHVSVCLGLLFAAFNSGTSGENCSRTNFMKEFGCSFYHSRIVPSGYVMAMLGLPTVLAMFLGVIPWQIQIFSWCLNFGTILFCTLYFQIYLTFESLVFIVPVSLLFLYSQHLQAIRLFLASENQQQLTVEKAKLTELEHLEEMRSLIGNMAHDLKTVSFFFVLSFVMW